MRRPQTKETAPVNLAEDGTAPEFNTRPNPTPSGAGDATAGLTPDRGRCLQETGFDSRPGAPCPIEDCPQCPPDCPSCGSSEIRPEGRAWRCRCGAFFSGTRAQWAEAMKPKPSRARYIHDAPEYLADGEWQI